MIRARCSAALLAAGDGDGTQIGRLGWARAGPGDTDSTQTGMRRLGLACVSAGVLGVLFITKPPATLFVTVRKQCLGC